MTEILSFCNYGVWGCIAEAFIKSVLLTQRLLYSNHGVWVWKFSIQNCNYVYLQTGSFAKKLKGQRGINVDVASWYFISIN